MTVGTASPSWSSSVRAAVAPFLVSRAVVLGALALARFLVTELRPRTGGAAVAAHAGLLGWDANWYRRIATMGFGGAGKASLRFFPLYPLAVRGLDYLPGIGAGVSLLLIANVAGFAAVVLLHRLCATELVLSPGRAGRPDPDLPSRSAWWLAMFPAAVVLSMGYADALFLALSIGVFLGLRRQQFLAAAACGVLAGLCRPVGFLLLVPSIIEAAGGWSGADRRQRLERLAAVLSAPIGTLAYLAWSASQGEGFFEPIRLQTASQNRGGVADPFVTIARDLSDLAHGHHLGTALHGPWALVLIVLAVVVVRRWPPSYGAYAVVTLVLTLSAPNLTSLERYALGCFPFSLALASLTRRRDVCWGALAISGAALASYALLTFLGAYVP